MLEQSAYRIMLLPQNEYWGWVGAARDYAVRFQTTLTPTPQNAARFHFPRQVITVVVTPDGYPQYGNIVAWLRSEAPGVQLDILHLASADDLGSLLNERIARSDPLWTPAPIAVSAPPAIPPLAHESPQPDESLAPRLHDESVETEFTPPSIQLLWPSDYADVLQGFGDNPDLYQRFGYPGHEGIDIKAPLNSNVYACAAGQVYHVDDGSGGHAYGIHICIRHANGFSTFYAHLNEALVHAGQEVGAGEQIGLANSTGNATTSHLHLTLTKAGATQAGLTLFPNDIIDPTPYLVGGPQQAPIGRVISDWPYDRCLIGLNSSDDSNAQVSDWELLGEFEAIKFNSNDQNDVVDRSLTINSDMFMLAHLRANMSRQVVTPANFVGQVRGNLQRHYDHGVRYFELHNEPNLSVEGFGITWGSGTEFGDWYSSVVALLRSDFPEARFGWPGLSPGPTEGFRFDFRAFLDQASAAIAQADWIGCHCYWQPSASMYTRSGGLSYRHYSDLWPDKLLLITDFANVSPSDAVEQKSLQYREYYEYLNSEPGVGAAFLSLAHARESTLHVQSNRSDLMVMRS